ncbi:uncharacterized protein LOC130614818 [Hydractinia symbiolongicarpus]|uniref:uncharacterized protein LOC130614818 n=1 Tax=Hydractinia symbiolongicarpus TaxID=13093 RepID=UPI00254E0260|nr:uncharacterized protein LOC130614818 [Hydractinia symbiolongicarpus]
MITFIAAKNSMIDNLCRKKASLVPRLNKSQAKQIPGYQFGYSNRDQRKGGGVGFYIKTSIKFKERKDINELDKTIEHQWIEISGKCKRSNILLGTVYQPSSKPADKLSWLEKFDNLLSQIVAMNEGSIIITGDFNINLNKSTVESRLYLDILETYNMSQQVSKSTRKDVAMIDHIISDQSLKTIYEDIVYCGEISDHDAPFCIFKSKPAKYNPRYKFVRDERIIEDFSRVPLSIVYTMEDMSDKLNVLNTLIIECINTHAPLKRVKLTRPPAPWMKELKITELQRERNRLRKEVRGTTNNIQWNLLRAIRNKLKKQISLTKSIFLRKLKNKSTKDVWKVINKILHPNPKNVNVNPDAVNEFFNSTATRTTGINKHLPGTTTSQMNSFTDKPNSFQLTHATFQDVINAIRSSRLDCSTGFDNIPARYIKYVADYIASPLTHIINCCIDNPTFPEQWKISRICPIPKVTNPSNLADYRPISVLPVLSKVFERIILMQITNFIEKSSVYCSTQSG